MINSTLTGNVSNMYNDPDREREGGGIQAQAYQGTGATVQVDLWNNVYTTTKRLEAIQAETCTLSREILEQPL